MAGGGGNSLHRPTSSTREEKEPCDRDTSSLCRRAIKNINYGKKNLSARAREGGHIYQDARLIYLPDTNKSF